MNLARVLVIGFFGIMVIMVGFYLTEDTVTPELKDTATLTDSVLINPNPNEDNLDIKDSAEIGGANYFIDEDGKKHYTLDIYDSPSLND